MDELAKGPAFIDKYYDKHGKKKDTLGFLDQIWLESSSIKARRKSTERIDQIKSRLRSDVDLCDGERPKYRQVRRFHEYKILKQFVESDPIFNNYDLLWCNSIKGATQLTNKLIKIIAGSNLCCRECSSAPSMINDKVPVMYVYLSPKSSI